ncbi:hypothetical protein [Wolbachia endosymbiont of Madathamugadia hiepei]|uniref:hypothetical protein n=1 Tax=Wolbachia endosymbiont of Madathamugadia hiepei TaxID=1241303 RepID=UPI001FE3C432|nr:hypothetical protein [Wolbachia endosymbiont of Madathamugadia hiepei]
MEYFDSLSVVDGHIGKGITIPKKILLGSIMLRSKKGTRTHLNVANTAIGVEST